MSVTPPAAQSLLDAIRYLWRGTRWAKGKERYVEEAVAGYIHQSDGTMRPFGELHQAVVDAYLRADLDPISRLVISEYYGLVAFPSDLASGPNPLLGRVRTSTNRQSAVASRSAISAARKSGVEAMAAALTPRPLGLAAPLVPLGDPLEDERLRKRLDLDGDPDEALLEACVYAAFDLTDRSSMGEEIRRAVEDWKRRWLGGPEPAVKLSVPFAAQRAAFAALHLALWDLGPLAARRDSRDPPAPIVLWPPSAIDSPKPGRVIATERWGVIDQVDLTREDLICLVGLVFNDQDPDGAAADFVIPILAHPEAAPPVNKRTYDLLVWGVIRFLASRGDWRAMELVMALATSTRRPANTPLYLAWAAHVASMFHHDALAWRLTNQADRLIDRRPELKHTTGRIVLQVRSGISARAADALLDVNAERGAAELRRSLHFAQQARDMGKLSARTGSVPVEVPVDLRGLEVLLVAHRYRSRGHEPGMGDPVSLDFIRSKLAEVKAKVEAAADLDDDDSTILMARIAGLEQAVATAELDDSALGPFLGHQP